MNKEELLKSISSLLKKHEDFLNENPDIFYSIEERFIKAVNDYDDGDEDPIFTQLEDEPDYYDDEQAYGEGGYGEELFGDPQQDQVDEYQDEEDEADRWLREQEAKKEQQPETEAEPVEQEQAKPIEQAQPKQEYSDEATSKIKEFLDQGYSEREAHRMSGVGRKSMSFFDALKSKLDVSEPSPKMLEEMKSIAKNWLSDARKNTEYDPKKNPILNASGKALQAHEDVHRDFSEAYNNFLNSEELKSMSRKERRQAIKDFKSKYHEENPDHRSRAASAADAGAAYSENSAARKQQLMDGLSAILTAGQVNVTDQPQGYSEQVAGAGGTMTSQAAAQMVGGEKGEGGYQANIKKDPAMLFAEQNPEVVKQLKEKLKGKLDPSQSQRMSAIDSIRSQSKKDIHAATKVNLANEQSSGRKIKTLDDKGLQHINDHLIEYAPLINIISSKLGRNLPDHIDDGDLLTAGMHGLIDAFHTYDASRGASFKGHAGRRIEGKMRDYISAGGPNAVDKYFYDQVRKKMGTNNPTVSQPADSTPEAIATPQAAPPPVPQQTTTAKPKTIIRKKPEGSE